MKRLARVRSAALLLASVLALSACGGDSDSSTSTTAGGDSGSALVEAAKKEGSVSVYWTSPPGVIDAIGKAFEKKYGISVRAVPGNMATLGPRYQTEGQSGKAGADVFLESGGGAAGKQAVDAGFAVPIKDAGIPVVQSGTFPQKYLMGTEAVAILVPWQLTYNKDKIGSSPPADWKDLLDPKYKGKIATSKPGTSASLVQFWLVMAKAYGDDFVRQLIGQAKFYETSLTALQATASGETLVNLPSTGPGVAGLLSQGAPIQIVPPSTTTAVQFGVILTAPKVAPHPNAGKLFVDYLLSEEGNKVANDFPGSYTVYDPAKLPSNYQEPPAVTPEDAARVSELLGVE